MALKTINHTWRSQLYTSGKWQATGVFECR